MLKALFKKQFLELNAYFFHDKKTGKTRSKKGIVGYVFLYLFVFLSLFFIFFALSTSACGTLVALKLDWMYFALMSLVAVTLGVFGSVFSTFSTLYLAKDNELLLSMPIPPTKILTARLFGVWFWGTFYEIMVLLPAVIVYWTTAKVTPIAVITEIILILALSFFILTLSCILGWVVAKISVKLKNKSYITVIVSIAFLAAYWYCYSNAYKLIGKFIEDAENIGRKIRGAAYPIYLLGNGACGDILSMFIFVLGIAAIFAVVYIILSKSFIKLATATASSTKKKIRKNDTKVNGVSCALLKREAKRYTSSANYMLNCSLGTLFMPVLAIVALVKLDSIRSVISEIIAFSSADFKGIIMLFVIGGICMITSFNDISAPSISIEGKNIWILQSLPVLPWQVLKAKLRLHIILTAIPTVILSAVLAFAVEADLFYTAAIIVIPLLYVLLSASFGLMLNLKMPNLKWTNEVVAVKQSASVTIALFGGWILMIALGILYWLLYKFISAEIFIGFVVLFFLLSSILILNWLRTKGAKIFASL